MLKFFSSFFRQIPFFPVVKKDLTFIHLGNDTRVDGLINFEKLRMIAKEVRSLSHMCSAPYDLFTMLQLGGQPPSAAMMAMNQLTTGSGMAGGNVHHQDRHHLSSSATVKRRKKSTAVPHPKKMFEEAQMVRRVKAYLSNMKVIKRYISHLLFSLSLNKKSKLESSLLIFLPSLSYKRMKCDILLKSLLMSEFVPFTRPPSGIRFLCTAACS